MSNLSDYRKQRKRIRDFISRNKRKGYFFDYELPPIPKAPTKKDVERLKRVTPNTLRKIGFFVEPSTGEAYSAESYFKQKRKEAAKRAADTRRRVDPDEMVVLPVGVRAIDGDNYFTNRLRVILGDKSNPQYRKRRSDVVAFSDKMSDLLLSILDDEIAKRGAYAVTSGIPTASIEILLDSAHDVMQESSTEHIRTAVISIANALRGRAPTFAEAMAFSMTDET